MPYRKRRRTTTARRLPRKSRYWKPRANYITGMFNLDEEEKYIRRMRRLPRGIVHPPKRQYKDYLSLRKKPPVITPEIQNVPKSTPNNLVTPSHRLPINPNPPQRGFIDRLMDYNPFVQGAKMIGPYVGEAINNLFDPTAATQRGRNLKSMEYAGDIAGVAGLGALTAIPEIGAGTAIYNTARMLSNTPTALKTVKFIRDATPRALRFVLKTPKKIYNKVTGNQTAGEFVRNYRPQSSPYKAPRVPKTRESPLKQMQREQNLNNKIERQFQRQQQEVSVRKSTRQSKPVVHPDFIPTRQRIRPRKEIKPYHDI